VGKEMKILVGEELIELSSSGYSSSPSVSCNPQTKCNWCGLIYYRKDGKGSDHQSCSIKCSRRYKKFQMGTKK
jgi:hypothetical protein